MNNILPALAAILLMTGCTAPGQKVLVLYYSQCGTTKAVAEEISAQTGADICAFDVTKPYDGSYEETIQRCLQERADGVVPELKPLECDLSKYDVVFLGYPIWFGTFAPPVKALLASADFSGKTIVPFCSFGSGGLQKSTADLRAALSDADIKEGYGVRTAPVDIREGYGVRTARVDIREGYGVRTARIEAAAEELDRFLIENGWKAGEVEPLPEYSALEPVSEAEAAIFDAACSGYQFPLGTPVEVGSRAVPGGVDYLFTAESTGLDGQVARTKVHVIVREGQAPVFTQVER